MSAWIAEAWIVEAARQRGPIAAGCYRAVVVESQGNLTHHDFPTLEAARLYANDAASEAEDHPAPLAYVLDDNFTIVDQGQHYAT
jgi:hypothetical protein